MSNKYECHECTKGNDTKPCIVIIDYGTMEHTSLCVANGKLNSAKFIPVST